METDVLLLGDCLDILPTLPAQSIDMVLCDLPYAKTSVKWDKLIPIDVLWREYARLVKPHGAIVLTAQQPFSSHLISSNPRWYRHSWIWDRGRGIGVNANYAPIPHHEDILVFCRGRVNYYPIKTPLARPEYATRHSESTLFRCRAGEGGVWYTDRFPTSILRIPQVGNTAKERFHPTQKPVALFDYLIRTYSQPGDVVLDNASGSATTAEAAYRAERHFICIEQDQVYFQRSQERIARIRRTPYPIALFDKPTVA